MARFTAIPQIPTSGLIDWQVVMFHTIKENVELLTGQRGEFDLASQAITRGAVRISQLAAQNLQTLKPTTMNGVTAQGQGFEVEAGKSAANFSDYVKLIEDVQRLGNDHRQLRSEVQTLLFDVKNTRDGLNSLIQQLTGGT
jgi:hypothetical protein